MGRAAEHGSGRHHGGLGRTVADPPDGHAHEAPSLAAASNHAAFNLANALGPWFGGMAITAGYGWTSTGYIGAATALVGLGLYLIARRMKGGH